MMPSLLDISFYKLSKQRIGENQFWAGNKLKIWEYKMYSGAQSRKPGEEVFMPNKRHSKEIKQRVETKQRISFTF